MEENTKHLEELINAYQMLLKQVNGLQERVAISIEDQIISAQHINALKNIVETQNHNNIKNVETIKEVTDDLTNGVMTHFSDNENGIFHNFLQELVKEDFVSKQNVMIEDAKREILSLQKAQSRGNKGGGISGFLKGFSPYISYLAFIIVCFLGYRFYEVLEVLKPVLERLQG